MGNAWQRFNQLVFCCQRTGCLRGAPAGLSALLSQTAISQLLRSDLSPFHCSQDAEAEDEQPVVCKSGDRCQASPWLLVSMWCLLMLWRTPHQCWSRRPCNASSWTSWSLRLWRGAVPFRTSRRLPLNTCNAVFTPSRTPGGRWRTSTSPWRSLTSCLECRYRTIFDLLLFFFSFLFSLFTWFPSFNVVFRLKVNLIQIWFVHTVFSLTWLEWIDLPTDWWAIEPPPLSWSSCFLLLLSAP